MVMELMYKYNYEDKSIDYDTFWQDKSGDFNKDDKSHVLYMVMCVKERLSLDEYGVKRLESAIKTELPFFASKRVIARKWLIDNFNM